MYCSDNPINQERKERINFFNHLTPFPFPLPLPLPLPFSFLSYFMHHKGYVRVILTLVAFYFVHEPYLCVGLYALAAFLDVLDGHAARLLNQGYNHSLNQSINQPVNQSANQSTSQSVN